MQGIPERALPAARWPGSLAADAAGATRHSTLDRQSDGAGQQTPGGSRFNRKGHRYLMMPMEWCRLGLSVLQFPRDPGGAG